MKAKRPGDAIDFGIACDSTGAVFMVGASMLALQAAQSHPYFSRWVTMTFIGSMSSVLEVSSPITFKGSPDFGQTLSVSAKLTGALRRPS